MRIHLISVGRKMPDWVQQGVQEYARRLPAEYKFTLHEVAPVVRNKSITTDKAKREEADRIRRIIPAQAYIVCLDEHGKHWNTRQLATQLDDWQQSVRDLALIIGGADGIDADFLAAARQKWSLSNLTFPHGMVRVMVIEQLYRAWSLLQGHPYHRD